MPKGKSYIDLGIMNKSEICSWVEFPSSTLLWIDGFATPESPKWTTELTVDITLAGDQEGYTMLFYFCNISSTAEEETETMYLGSQFAMLHSFIVQVLQQHPSIIEKFPEIFNVEVFRQAKSSLRATSTILREALGALLENTTVCMVIDSIDDLHGAKERSTRLQFILKKFSELVVKPRNIVIKIMITSVTSEVHGLLFPESEDLPPGHSILRIPRNLENAHIIHPPTHLRRRIPRRLARIPDSDMELGIKPVDSFEASESDDGNESDVSLDESVSGNEIIESERVKKAALMTPHSAALTSSPFKTVRETFQGAAHDVSSSSDISVSDNDSDAHIVQTGGLMQSEEEYDLSSTDSEYR
jgi:hypothetical protein